MNVRSIAIPILLAALAAPLAPASAGRDRDLPRIRPFEASLERRAGLFDVLLDRERGRLFLEFPAVGGDGRTAVFVHVAGLAGGLGSNPVGLDRGQIGPTRIVSFRRVGRRVLLEQHNVRYRADRAGADEARAARESFATSVLWAGDVVAEDPVGRFVVDATTLVARDAHGVAATLRAAGQGEWTFDPARSVIDPEACLAFPDNVELEATITFAGAAPGGEVVSVAPQPDAVTLAGHLSFVRLPDDGYRPRAFDPRSGSFDLSYADYAAPLDAPLVRRLLVRHRLIARDPGATPKVPVEPIVYHVDRGIPEPVRSAVLEGAGWWARAFEAAGWRDAFRVELLPEGAHPLDVRYDVIEWVHRSTRGWSYGGGIVDPRSGEVIKGHVNLGSLRVRQDRLLFEGLVGADRTGTGAPDDPIELALARIRQLAAHEVGHALGFDHNFAASTYEGRASVMDYPAPLVRVRPDGTFDLADAYGVGVGRWDLQATRYAYGAWADADAETAGLAAILLENAERGWRFLNDADARAIETAHPLAGLWDNGSDPAGELLRALEVRRIALDRFGPDRIAPGRPLAELEEVLLPLYFHHRYQLEAAVKSVGGVDYAHRVRDDGVADPRPVPADDQRRALDAILALLDPATLDLPDRVLAAVPPRAPGYAPNAETFRGATSPTFDPLAAAGTAAAHVLDALLRPERCARLVEQHRRDPALPGLESVLGAVVDRAFAPLPDGERRAEIARVVRERAVDALIVLADSDAAPGPVRARVEASLAAVAGLLEAGGDPAHDGWLRARILRWLERGVRDALPAPPAPAMPPGSPIGAAACSRGV